MDKTLQKDKLVLSKETKTYVCPLCGAIYGYVSPHRVWIKLCECLRKMKLFTGGADERQKEES